jgi:multiple sugar transport system permease protein
MSIPLNKPKGSSHDRSTTFAFWVLVAPALLGLAVFTVVPIIWGFLLSLSHAQNTIHVGHFVGLF